MILVWITFMAGTLPRTIAEVHMLEEWLRFAMFALVALLMGCLISLSRSAHEQEKALVKQIAPKRWNSVARIVRAQESERKRISRELHNESLQDLLVIVNHMHAIERGAYGEIPEKTRKQVVRIENEVLTVIDNLRKMSHGLNVTVLDNTGLVPALKWLTEGMTQETGIKVTMNVLGKEHKLKAEAEVMIFRIAQEALSNIRQHSKATAAVATLDFSGRDFKLIVEDNGCGFKVTEYEQGGGEESELGLDIIRQRAKLLGGKLNICSEPGKGTVITLEAPV
jgi:signal transduction histidine kinase